MASLPVIIWSLLMTGGTIAFVTFASPVSGDGVTPHPGGIKAIVFQGGGFRAHAVITGVLTGLASLEEDEMRSNDSAPAHRTDSEVYGLPSWLEEVEILSSTSGGTWMAAQLLYSPE